MIRCRKCRQPFHSKTAYGIHTWMQEKQGRKIVCPTTEQLKEQGMIFYEDAWMFGPAPRDSDETAEGN